MIGNAVFGIVVAANVGRKLLLVVNAHMVGSKKTCGDCSRFEREGDHYKHYCHIRGSFIFDGVICLSLNHIGG